MAERDMSLIHRLFGSRSDATVLCPRCERSLEGHDEADCARRMSRRYFFGLAVGAAASVYVAPSITDAASVPAPVRISRYPYRIPLQIYRGGAFGSYNPGSADLGIGSTITAAYKLVESDIPRSDGQLIGYSETATVSGADYERLQDVYERYDTIHKAIRGTR